MSEENKTFELNDEDLEKITGGKVYSKPQSSSGIYLNPEDSCNKCSSCGVCSYYSNHKCTWGRS